MTWILLAALTQAGSLRCADAEEAPTVVYESWGKSGGARPGPETTVSSASWTVDGKELHRSEKKYLGPTETTGDLNWEWLQDKTTDVEVLVRNRNLKRVRYRTEVRLSRPSGASLPGGRGPTWTVALTCLREERYGVP